MARGCAIRAAWQSGSQDYIVRRERAFFARQILVVAIPLLAVLSTSAVQSWRLLVFLGLLASASNLIYYVLTVKKRFVPHLKWPQITIDLLIWTALVELTGGARSFFYLGYVFEIFVCAITLSIAACIYAGSVAVLLYAVFVAGHSANAIATDLLPKFLFTGGASALAAVLVHKFNSIHTRLRALNQILEKKIEAADEELRKIIASMTSGLIAVDGGGKIVQFNAAAEEITGIDASQAVGESVESVFRGQEEIIRALGETREGHAEIQPFRVRAHFGGKVRILEIRPFSVNTGHSTETAALLNDVTEIVELREKMMRTHALSVLGTTVAAVAHDLRNPLTSIRGFLSLLKRRRSNRETEESDMIERVEKGVGDLERTVNDLLLYGNPPSLAKERVDFQKIVESALTFLPMCPENIDIVKDFNDGATLVDVDPVLIQRCVLNLLANSTESMRSGGTMQLSTRRTPEGVAFSVSDTGPGVPVEIRDRIFKPFFTTKKNGTGLGLAIVKNIVELHGGKITVGSARASGAEFVINLPAAAPTPIAGKATPADPRTKARPIS